MNITFEQLNEMLDLFDKFGQAMFEAGLCKDSVLSTSAFDDFRKPFIGIIDELRGVDKCDI